MSNSQIYENESEIPTADHEEPDHDVDSPHLSWMGYAFVLYLLGAGASGVVGLTALYVAVMPFVLGLTFVVLAALDARRIPDWGPGKYGIAVCCLFPPMALVYYWRRRKVVN